MKKMRIFCTIFLAATIVFAVPSPHIGPNPRSVPENVNSLTLTQPLNNATSSVAEDRPIICFQDLLFIHSVNAQACSPLIATIIARPDYAVPKLWLPGPMQPEYVVQTCRLRIISGNWRALFSLRDVVAEMVRVLEICQPPRHFGSGGSTPVAGVKGLMYASFHVEVTGVKL